jgi:plastocyanin
MKRSLVAAVVTAVLLSACGGGNSKDEASAPAPSEVASTASATPEPSPPKPPKPPKDCPQVATKIELSTVSAQWVNEKGHIYRTGEACIVVPAGERFTVTVHNDPKGKGFEVNHNFSIYPAAGVTDELFYGDELVYAGETVTYRPPALEKGRYLFQCDIHPTGMWGVIDVK